MASSGYVLVFILDKSCGGCIQFEPEHAKLERDADLRRVFDVKTIRIDQRNGKDMPKVGFKFVRYLPTIAIIPSSAYGTELANANNEVYMGSRTLGEVKKWAMNYAETHPSAPRSGPTYAYGGSYGQPPQYNQAPRQQAPYSQPTAPKPTYSQPNYGYQDPRPQTSSGVNYGKRGTYRPTAYPPY